MSYVGGYSSVDGTGRGFVNRNSHDNFQVFLGVI